MRRLPLCKQLLEGGADLSTLPERFTAARLDDMHALVRCGCQAPLHGKLRMLGQLGVPTLHCRSSGVHHVHVPCGHPAPLTRQPAGFPPAPCAEQVWLDETAEAQRGVHPTLGRLHPAYIAQAVSMPLRFLLSRATGGRVLPPAVVCMNETCVPFASIQRMVQRDSVLLAAAAAAGVAAAAAALMRRR